MFLIKLSHYQRSIIVGLLPFLLCLLIEVPSFSQSKPADEERTQNVKWKTINDVIVINYDLIGSSEIEYEISVMMKKENDDSFSAVPLTVEGDIGEGYFAGTNREIRWYYRRDYPLGFLGGGYYFEIQVKRVAMESSWIYYALGAAALAGGVVALLISKNQTEQQPTVSELPTPPGRP